MATRDEKDVAMNPAGRSNLTWLASGFKVCARHMQAYRSK
jgi:hypothetical protein